MSTGGDLQLVPETLLKKRHDLDNLRAQRAASALSRPASRKRASDKSKAIKIIKPETLVIQSRQRRKGATRFNRVSRKGMQKRASDKAVVKTKLWDSAGEKEVEEKDLPRVDGDAEEASKNSDDESTEEKNDVGEHIHKISYKANSAGASTVFAVLLRPTDHTAPKPIRKTLSSLRLRRINEGVFLRYDPPTRKMLHLVEPYVLYGVLDAETASDLVRRRGFCRAEGKRAPLADNNVVERELGGSGLICVEDVVHVLSDGGGEGDAGAALFGSVAKFLWPFRLTARKSKFQRKILNIKDGKLYGDQGDAMNGYIREML